MMTVRQGMRALIAAAVIFAQSSATATPGLRAPGQRPQMAFSTPHTGLVEVGGVRGDMKDSLSSAALGGERSDAQMFATMGRCSSHAQLPRISRQASSVSMSIPSEPRESREARPAEEVRQDSRGFAWVPIGVHREGGGDSCSF
mmetsp:Transcript_40483/g.99412  ORF Transcript_40483/g.99412 Transcript_40483/m.99412 type:complete len:144 (+) Transcript_40483:187-618(+)